jgi:hypothetical protein
MIKIKERVKKNIFLLNKVCRKEGGMLLVFVRSSSSVDQPYHKLKGHYLVLFLAR